MANNEMHEIEVNATRSRWKTRRLMAWCAFLTAIGSFMYGIVWIRPPDLNYYETLYSSFFIFSGSIVATYIGFATWDDVSNGNGSRFSLVPKKKISADEIDESEDEPKDAKG